jgi:hypothetical protein
MSKAKDEFLGIYHTLNRIIQDEGLRLSFWGWDYSGRGMFGDVTPAWSGNWDDIETLKVLGSKALGYRLSTDDFACDGIIYCDLTSHSRKKLSEADWEELEEVDSGQE